MAEENQDTSSQQDETAKNEPVQSETVPTTKTETAQTFTQEDVTRIAAKEKREGKLSATKELLAELGIENMDEIKAMLTDAKKRKEADMSEADKTKAALDTMTAERDAANTKLAEQSATQLQSKRDGAIRKAMLAGGAKEDKSGKQIDRLLVLIDNEMASDKSNLFGDGKSDVESTKMDAFVKQVQSQMGSYFGTAGAGSPPIMGRNPSAAINRDEAIQAYTNRIRGR